VVFGVIMKKSAYSLIELMVVVAIIAVLAAVVVPFYKDYIIKSNFQSLIPLTDAVKQKIMEFHNQGGIWGTDPYVIYSANDINKPRYLRQLAHNGQGCIILEFDLIQAGLEPDYNTHRLCLMQCPSDSGTGTVDWTCGYHPGCSSTSDELNYLPNNCLTPIVFVDPNF
jgi:type IV pilus assembly protein PilA